MGLNTVNLGITTKYFNCDFSNLADAAVKAVEELKNRQGKSGQFLNWVELPSKQLGRVDEIYEKAQAFKAQTDATMLSVLGIGGSKHPVEHMLSINGLNLDGNIKFFSDIDSVSLNRFLHIIGDVTKSRYLVVSKSGTTFEPKDALIRIKKMLVDTYMNNGATEEQAKELMAKHFIAVTDKNTATSELRRTSNSEGWLGDLYIHDDVGGRFSAFDDHTLFALAYAGMSKEDMIAMLNGAVQMTEAAMSANFDSNDALAQAAFWASAKANGAQAYVHQYLGSLFEYTVNWHAQMQNESVKDTLKQIAKVPDAMHHSAEAHFNPANKLAFGLTTLADNGVAKANVEGYVGALNKTYAQSGPHFNEIVDVAEFGLTPFAAGALTQSRAFATVYQELIEKFDKGIELPVVLDSVLQPYVETYKKNLKPQPGEPDVVLAGRIS